MGVVIGNIIGILLFAFITVIVIRTLEFKPQKAEPANPEALVLDEDKIVSDMQDMIRCKTVSYMDESLVDRAEFAKFEALLKERFPKVHEAATLTKIGVSGLLYHIPGKSDQKPSVCMAHYDVVPVEEEGWGKPAFEGIIEEGCIWGRGTLDTKGTLCGIFEALEHLLKQGYVPENDLYLSFSGDEEISGESCPDIVDYLKKKGYTVEKMQAVDCFCHTHHVENVALLRKLRKETE
jgi:carboxypeptidase PM20D1